MEEQLIIIQQIKVLIKDLKEDPKKESLEEINKLLESLSVKMVQVQLLLNIIDGNLKCNKVMPLDVVMARSVIKESK